MGSSRGKRRRGVFHSLCLRVRIEFTRWRRLVRGFVFRTASAGHLLPLDRARDNPAAHVAVVTFDVSEKGLVPVARTHSELFAGGLAVILESRLAPEANILSALLPASFAGLSLTILPWLFSGGTLSHHPFDPDLLAWQRREDRCTALILPGPVAMRLDAAGAFADEAPGTVMRRAMGRAAGPDAEWNLARPAYCIDRRSGIRRSGASAGAPRIFRAAGASGFRRGGRAAHDSGAVTLAELIRTVRDTLAVRGPMVPHHAYRPGWSARACPIS